MGEIKIPGWGAFIVILVIIIVLTMWIGSWECSNSSSCDSGEICTSNHICYKPETVNNTIIKTEYKFVPAAIILGVSVIIASLILRNKDLRKLFRR